MPILNFSRFVRATTLAALSVLALVAQTTAQAADAKAYVSNFKDNSVSVIDTGRAAVVATIPVAAGPHGMALSPDGRTLYVSGDGSAQVSVIDTASDSVSRFLEVGKSPHGLAMAPDGKRLLVAVYAEDRLGLWDTASGTQVGSIPVAKPHTVTILPDGKKAYVASQQPGKFNLTVIDLLNASVLREVTLDKPPRDIEAAFDGRAVYITVAGENAVLVLDPRSDSIVARVPTGVSPHIATLVKGAGVGTVVVQGPGELTLFDPATNTVLRSISVGKQPHWAATNAGGTTAYVSNEGSNDLSIVDLASGAVRTVPVGTAPRKVVVQQSAPASAGSGAVKVSIANFAFAPGELRIQAGQSVTWVNDDGAPHGLAHADGAKGADLLLPGASVSRRYDTAGSFDYVCSVHPYMTGKVVVSAR